MVKLTKLEASIIKNLIYYCDITKVFGFKYIARNKDGALFMFREKPNKSKESWVVNENIELNSIITPYCDLFKFIKWIDKEPWKIEDLLNNTVWVSQQKEVEEDD